MTIKKQIEYCLKTYPETRNSDIKLMITLWREFYTIRDNINVEQLYDLPKHDVIKRHRARLNQRGLYYPTELKIVKLRKLNEDKWREEMGYPPLNETIYPTKEESYTNQLYNAQLFNLTRSAE